MSALRQAPRIGRHALLVLLAIVVTGSIIVILAGGLSRSTDIGSRAEQARAELAAVADRVEAGERELAWVDSEAFIQQMARAHGFGEPGERAFALDPDAPPPDRIVPIGPVDIAPEPAPPFEAWMELLFGA